MSGDRLPTYLWLDAMVREVTARGVGIYITQRGERMGGMVLVKIADTRGQCRLILQQRDLDGVLQWVPALKEDITDEKSADEYIARAVSRDPDLWVVEVEDQEMKNPLSLA